MAAHNIIIAADVDDTHDRGGRLGLLRVAAESAEKKYIAAKEKSDEARGRRRKPRRKHWRRTRGCHGNTSMASGGNEK